MITIYNRPGGWIDRLGVAWHQAFVFAMTITRNKICVKVVLRLIAVAVNVLTNCQVTQEPWMTTNVYLPL